MLETAPSAAHGSSGDDGGAAGFAVYTPLTLAAYDVVVHGLSNRLAWKCSAACLRQHYRDNLSANHLEAGVGTGLFIDMANRHRFDRLTLLDANSACLAAAAKRLKRYRPALLRHNLLDDLPELPSYDSVGLTYVLHCLPGPMAKKLQVLDRLRSVMHRSGVIFGATILGSGVVPNFAARRLLGLYNRRGVFDNRGDDVAGLKNGLEQRFAEVSIAQQGCVALFRATGNRKA
jgi:Methyltransferase domain